MSVPNDVREFSAAFSAELETDGWGAIDPWIFQNLGDPAFTPASVNSGEDHMAMARVIARTLARLKEGKK